MGKAKKVDVAAEYMASGIVADVIAAAVENEKIEAGAKKTRFDISASVYAFMVCWILKNAARIAKQNEPTLFIRRNVYAAFGQKLKDGIEPEIQREASKTVKSAIDNLFRAMNEYGQFYNAPALVKAATVHDGNETRLCAETLHNLYREQLKAARELHKEKKQAAEKEAAEKQRLAVEQALEQAGISLDVLEIIQNAKLAPISAKIIA